MKNFEEYQNEWKRLANRKMLFPEDFVVRAAINALYRAEKSNKMVDFLFSTELDKFFTRVSNKNKLENGYHAFKSIELALRNLLEGEDADLHQETFMKLCTRRERNQILDLMKTLLSVFNALKANFEAVELPLEPYVYVFVDETLSYAQRAIQVGHAMFVMGAALSEIQAVNPIVAYNIVLFGVTPEFLATEYHEYFAERNVQALVVTQEPDMDMRNTVIATLPLFGRERKAFADMEILRDH